MAEGQAVPDLLPASDAASLVTNSSNKRKRDGGSQESALTQTQDALTKARETKDAKRRNDAGEDKAAVRDLIDVLKW